MINILFYGNCQLYAVEKTLNLSPKKFKTFTIMCWLGEIDKNYFTDIIKTCDIIITQPINDNYRDVDYLSTSYIINNAKQNCKIIIFDSCYFNFYYFDLTYKMFNDKMLNKPIDYHYYKMMECYNDDLPIEHYIDNYANNIDFITSEELESIAENSLNELNNRSENTKNKYNSENIYVISIYRFVKNNYKKKLLFYSMNHPTKYLFHYICEKIAKILEIKNTIDYDIDVLAKDTKCILYKCIQKNVNFDINDYLPLVLGKNNIYDITKLYYDTYKSIGFYN